MVGFFVNMFMRLDLLYFEINKRSLALREEFLRHVGGWHVGGWQWNKLKSSSCIRKSFWRHGASLKKGLCLITFILYIDIVCRLTIFYIRSYYNSSWVSFAVYSAAKMRNHCYIKLLFIFVQRIINNDDWAIFGCLFLGKQRRKRSLKKEVN